MKKYFSYALSGAIALVSMYVFTACSSTDDALAAEQQKAANAQIDALTKEFNYDVDRMESVR